MVPHFSILIQTELSDDISKLRYRMRVLLALARLGQFCILAQAVTRRSRVIDSGGRHALLRLRSKTICHTFELIHIGPDQI